VLPRLVRLGVRTGASAAISAGVAH
jgi:hypothetical protein